MLPLIRSAAKHFMKYMRCERGFLQALIPIAASAAGGYLSSKKSKGSSGSSSTQTSSYQPTPGQASVDALMQQLATRGATPYTGERVAGLTANEQALQGGARTAFDSASPALTRILSGQFGPEQQAAFDASVADPARRQFNLNVRPEMRENAALTGNRFADRTAIAEGRATGELEAGIAQSRAQAQQEAYYAPAKYGPSAASTFGGFEDIFQTERKVNQAQDDAAYNEFLRTNPYAGGLLTSLLTGYAGSPTGTTTTTGARTSSVTEPGFDYGKLVGRAINAFAPAVLGKMGIR